MESEETWESAGKSLTARRKRISPYNEVSHAKALHTRATVQPGGKVEFASPELESGQTVDLLGKESQV